MDDELQERLLILDIFLDLYPRLRPEVQAAVRDELRAVVIILLDLQPPRRNPGNGRTNGSEG